MHKNLLFLDEVYFKHFPMEEEIYFIKLGVELKHFYRLQSKHCTSVYELFSQQMSSTQFAEVVKEMPLKEFQQILVILKDLSLIALDGAIADLKLALSDEGTLFEGQYFKLKYESLGINSSTDIFAQNEGGACSTQGEVQCGHDNTLYECISDGTWAGLGTSC